MKNNYIAGEKGQQPWGMLEVIHSEQGYVVKRIQLRPKQRLSMQYHSRSEVRITTSGHAKALIGDEWTDIPSGVSVTLPVGMIHAIENQSEEPLIFFEVQIESFK